MKEVLGGFDLTRLDTELQVNIGQIILHAYFRGQEDPQNELRANRAKAYVKEVLRGFDVSQLDTELQMRIGLIVLHAYFRGQEDLQNELSNPN